MELRKTYYCQPHFPTCTVLTHLKKYYDSDSGKWIRDKLEQIKAYTLYDIIDDGIHNGMTYPEPRNTWEYKSPFNIAKFSPKDDDFDLEVQKLDAMKKLS
jgi:hypothetical protein